MKKKITKSTNWLTAELTESELTVKKTLAIIAAELQSKRIEMGLDQKQFAKLLDVSQGMISRWESGMYNFTVTTLVNICEKLDLIFKPQITEKEIGEATTPKPTMIFHFTDFQDNKYSDWVPDRSAYQDNDIETTGAVA